ncbi:MAG: hypothetical protein LW850_02640 [Planctomycetaceae bacterium]|nr:hypothetical protein [Planctomycetaceae bacterium]
MRTKSKNDSAIDLVKAFTTGPVGGDTKNPRVENTPLPENCIWSDNVKLDNLVLFRKRIDLAPDGKERTDFSNLNNVVPEQPPRGDRRGQPK